MNILQYLASLPVVKTSDLPVGSLFVANRRMYEVTENQPGYSKAQEWRKGESTVVTLSEDASLSNRLTVVEEGVHIVPLASRNELLKDGRKTLYVFPGEQNALDAAYLDVALCGRGSSLYVRRHQQYAAFEATNGAVVFRQYFFMRTNQEVKTNLPDIKHRLGNPLISHLDGPIYWRLLASWDDSPYDDSKTQVMNRMKLTQSFLDETMPNPSPDDSADERQQDQRSWG